MRDPAIPNDKWARIIGIPAAASVGSFLTKLPTQFDHGWLMHYLVGLCVTFCVWQCNRWMVIYFRKTFPSVRETTRRILFQFSSAVILSSVLMLALCYLMGFFLYGRILPWELTLANLIIGLALTMLISTIYETVYFFQLWKFTIVEAEEIKRQNLMFQFESLKSQVNPHFLFNSLNTLTALIEEQPPQAVEFVQRLSQVYRYVLNSREKETIPLEEEIAFIRSYLYLLKARFGENLRVTIDIPETCMRHRVPPLALQLLVENAIKHNIVSTENPLELRIAAADVQHLFVENILRKKQRVEPTSGFGLHNIVSRYALLGRNDVTVSDDGISFRVSLPLLTPEIAAT